MDASGFPPHLYLFKATAVKLVSEEEGPPFGPTWLTRFLNRHPELSSKFASGLNRQRALSSKPGPIKDYFRSYRCSFGRQLLPHNIYDMEEQRLLLGIFNWAKVIVRRGSVRGHSRTQAIRGWPGPSTDGLVSATGLAMAGHSRNPRLAWLQFKSQKTI